MLNLDKLSSITEIDGVYRISVAELWNELQAQGEEPVKLIKYVAGEQSNPLANRAGESGLPRENFYLKLNSPIEIGHIQYPLEGNNLVDPRDLVHSHHTCNEVFVVTRGEVVLRTGIKNVTREPGIERIPERYNFEDGREVRLSPSQTKGTQRLPLPEMFNIGSTGLEFVIDPRALNSDLRQMLSSEGPVALLDSHDEVVAASYTTQPDSYHILTYVAPGTRLTLIKAANRNWTREGNWSDRHLHPVEQI